MKLITLACFGALAVGLGCQSASPPVTKSQADSTTTESAKNADRPIADTVDHAAEETAIENAKRISLADAKKDFDDGTAVFVDTRGSDFYQNEHIKGSVNVPSNDFDNTYKTLPKDKKIIAYCS